MKQKEQLKKIKNYLEELEKNKPYISEATYIHTKNELLSEKKKIEKEIKKIII